MLLILVDVIPGLKTIKELALHFFIPVVLFNLAYLVKSIISLGIWERIVDKCCLETRASHAIIYGLTVFVD